MGRRSVTLALAVLVAMGALGDSAQAEESGRWEADRRGHLHEELRRSLQDAFSGPPRVYWDRGPVLEAPKKAIVFHIGYEGQFDAIWYGGGDKEVEAAAGARWMPGLAIRRSRVVLEAFILRNWFIRARYDVSAIDDVDFQDLFVEWSGLTELKAKWWPVIRLGQVKEAMTIDWMNSAFRTTFAERAMFTTTIVPNRNPGIRANGTALQRRLTYQAGGYLINVGSLNEYGEGQGKAFTARVTGLAWDAGEKAGRLLHLGLSASWRWDVGEYEFASKPESWIGPNVIDTGWFPATRVTALAGEFFYQLDRLSFTVEGAWTRVHLPEGGEADFWGCYGAVSYFLTPGHIPYDRALGCFGRVRPNCGLFCPAKPGLGAWAVAARYSILDLDAGPSPGGVAWNITLGLNGYLRDNLRLHFNYIYTDVDDAYGVAGADGTMNALIVRLAYEL